MHITIVCIFCSYKDVTMCIINRSIFSTLLLNGDRNWYFSLNDYTFKLFNKKKKSKLVKGFKKHLKRQVNGKGTE